MSDQVKTIASALGVPDSTEHILQRIKEMHKGAAELELLRKKVESLTKQRDEFENMLHEEQNVNCRLLVQYTTMKKRYESVVQVARQVYIADLEGGDV